MHMYAYVVRVMNFANLSASLATLPRRNVHFKSRISTHVLHQLCQKHNVSVDIASTHTQEDDINMHTLM